MQTLNQIKADIRKIESRANDRLGKKERRKLGRELIFLRAAYRMREFADLEFILSEKQKLNKRLRRIMGIEAAIKKGRVEKSALNQFAKKSEIYKQIRLCNYLLSESAVV